MIPGATLALLLPSLAAHLLLTRRWGGASEAPFGVALAAAAAPGLGLGFASCVYFLLLHLTPNPETAVWLDGGLWSLVNAGLLVGAVRRRSRPPHSNDAIPIAPVVRRWDPVLVATTTGFGVVVLLAVYAFLLRYAIRPEGEWDAFAIWNLRARAIARGAPDWAAILSPAIQWSNIDYPILVPLTVARIWAYTGGESTAVPSVVGLLFMLSSVAMVVTGIGRLRGWQAGILGGIALLVARTYIYQGACQCADVPLAFYVLVAIAFVSVSNAGPMLFVAGAAAGLAAWTKNEGLVLLALVVLVAACRAPRLRGLAHVVAGAALPMAALAFFKLSVPSNYLLIGQGAADISVKLVDVTRWGTVLTLILDRVWAWGEVPGGTIVWLALAVVVVLGPDGRSARRAALGLLLIVAMLASYGLVFVITPLPLEWQFAVSFDRLFVHVWPALVWTVFQLSAAGPLRFVPVRAGTNTPAIDPLAPD